MDPGFGSELREHLAIPMVLPFVRGVWWDDPLQPRNKEFLLDLFWIHFPLLLVLFLHYPESLVAPLTPPVATCSLIIVLFLFFACIILRTRMSFTLSCCTNFSSPPLLTTMSCHDVRTVSTFVDLLMHLGILSWIFWF